MVQSFFKFDKQTIPYFVKSTKMTRILTLLFVLGVFFGTAFGEQFDVRKVRWGMSVDKVKASEKWGDPKSELRDDGLYEIMYKGKMLGESVMLGYVFDGDEKSRKLVSVTYAFSYNITLHLRLKTLLTDVTQHLYIL